MPTPLQLKSVTKRFHQGPTTVTAIDQVNLTVSQGEFIAIMGASGSGKSTLLHVIAGLTDVDEGQVLVDGQDISGLPDAKLTNFRRRRIGLIFQAYNLIPVLTAEDNIRLPASDLEGLEARVDALLDRLDMQNRRKHKIDALSGGEQQRVAIARALVTDPAIVLADEPTGSLDSATGDEICKLLRELSREQSRTIVMVTHEPAAAIWADRVVVLRDGHLVGAFQTEGLDSPQALSAAYQRALATEEAKA